MAHKRTRLRHPKEFITNLGIALWDGCGTHNNRAVRFLDQFGVFQVGEEDFDRWANSVDFEFNLTTKKGRKHLKHWAETGTL